MSALSDDAVRRAQRRMDDATNKRAGLSNDPEAYRQAQLDEAKATDDYRAAVTENNAERR